MTEPIRHDADEHPQIAELLLFVEDELDRNAAGRIRMHLSECWTCRAECERLQRGIFAFADYRERFLIPSIPPKPPTGEDFRRRLFHSAAGKRKPGSEGLLMRLRPAWLGGAVLAAIACLVWLIPITQPPAMNAATFIANAKAAARKTTPRTYQRIRIRYGSQIAERRRALGIGVDASLEPLPPEMAKAMSLAGMDPRNPLDAESFARWRDERKKGEDLVRESLDTCSLETLWRENGHVLSVSLTVNRSDWHAIGRRAHLPGLPEIEVTEIERVLQNAPAPREPVRSVPQAETADPHQQSAGLATESLERAEVNLRKTLHELRADIEEAPEILRDDSGLRLRVYTASSARKDQILSAVADIPHVKPDIYDLETTANHGPREVVETKTDELFLTTPPLAKRLVELHGGSEQVRNYLAQTQAAFEPVIQEALALLRLAERYPEAVYLQLPRPLQMALDDIAGDHLESIVRSSNKYLALLDPALEHFRSSGADSTALPPLPCRSWREIGQSLAPELLVLRRSWTFLFAIQALPRPETLNPDELLAQAAGARARAGAVIAGACR